MEKAVFTYRKDTYNAYDAQQIVFEAGKFESEIVFADGDKRANAKSIIGLLSMKFLQGNEYVIRAEGIDAKRAVRAMAEFIEKL